MFSMTILCLYNSDNYSTSTYTQFFLKNTLGRWFKTSWRTKHTSFVDVDSLKLSAIPNPVGHVGFRAMFSSVLFHPELLGLLYVYLESLLCCKIYLEINKKLFWRYYSRYLLVFHSPRGILTKPLILFTEIRPQIFRKCSPYFTAAYRHCHYILLLHWIKQSAYCYRKVFESLAHHTSALSVMFFYNLFFCAKLSHLALLQCQRFGFLFGILSWRPPLTTLLRQ